MPEQISKYPDVTLDVLREAGARCGEGLEQKILTQCPAERFCSLPTGEICVYGLDDISQMTQIKPEELALALGPNAQPADPAISLVEATVLGVVFVAGLALGGFWRKIRRSGSGL